MDKGKRLAKFAAGGFDTEMKPHRTFTVVRFETNRSTFMGAHTVLPRRANEPSHMLPVHDAATRRSPRIAGSVAAVNYGILSIRAACALSADTNGGRPVVPFAVAVRCRRTPIGISCTKRMNQDIIMCPSRALLWKTRTAHPR